MARQILEGPWEEILRQGDRLAGTRVRLEILEGEPNGSGEPPPFYATATPEERAKAFVEWARSHPVHEGPPLSDEAISRESIYFGED
jgi:hypothetical protein